MIFTQFPRSIIAYAYVTQFIHKPIRRSLITESWTSAPPSQPGAFLGRPFSHFTLHKRYLALPPKVLAVLMAPHPGIPPLRISRIISICVNTLQRIFELYPPGSGRRPLYKLRYRGMLFEATPVFNKNSEPSFSYSLTGLSVVRRPILRQSGPTFLFQSLGSTYWSTSPLPASLLTLFVRATSSNFLHDVLSLHPSMFHSLDLSIYDPPFFVFFVLRGGFT
jgi:hypothetical protein